MHRRTGAYWSLAMELCLSRCRPESLQLRSFVTFASIRVGTIKELTCTTDSSWNGTETNFDGIADEHALALLCPERCGGVERHATYKGQEQLDRKGPRLADEELMGEEWVFSNLPFPDS